jgi:hypothetical protein
MKDIKEVAPAAKDDEYEEHYFARTSMGLMAGFVVAYRAKKNDENPQDKSDEEYPKQPWPNLGPITKKRLNPPKHEASALTKYLRAIAAIGTIFVGLAELSPDQGLRFPTDQERAQLDRQLKPAAIQAANVALKALAKDDRSGVMNQPPPSMPHKQHAVEVYVSGRGGYSMIVDMQQKNGRPDPKTTYDVAILKGKDGDRALAISSVDLNTMAVLPDFFYAQTPADIAIDFDAQGTSSEINQDIKNASSIAQQLQDDLKEFKPVKINIR